MISFQVCENYLLIVVCSSVCRLLSRYNALQTERSSRYRTCRRPACQLDRLQRVTHLHEQLVRERNQIMHFLRVAASNSTDFSFSIPDTVDELWIGPCCWAGLDPFSSYWQASFGYFWPRLCAIILSPFCERGISSIPSYITY